MSDLQPNCCLKFDFQKVDQHAGGKWLIHDTKRRNDNLLQGLKLMMVNNLIGTLGLSCMQPNGKVNYPFLNIYLD